MKSVELILAEMSGFGRVRLCECNVVHMSVGPITMTLTVDAFQQAARLLSDASLEMAQIALSKDLPDDDSLPLASSLTH